ncbi:MAG: GNAT family N-acetyltransferase [Ilumatobacteraceae bacterium]
MITIQKCTFEYISTFSALARRERVIIDPTPNAIWWCIKFNGVLIGCASLLPIGTTARFRALWLDPRYRGNGFGNKLCDARLEYAVEHKFKKITAFLTKQGHRKWYEQNGFGFFGERNGIVFVSKELK